MRNSFRQLNTAYWLGLVLYQSARQVAKNIIHSALKKNQTVWSNTESGLTNVEANVVKKRKELPLHWQQHSNQVVKRLPHRKYTFLEKECDVIQKKNKKKNKKMATVVINPDSVMKCWV